MNPISLVGHVLELLQLIDNSRQPADKTASTFFRERKYLGSKDRRFISEAVYGIIRHRRYAEALLEQYLLEHPAHAELDDLQHRFLSLYTMYTATNPHLEHTIPTPDSLWRTTFPNIQLPPLLEWIAAHASLEYLDVDNLVRLGVKYSFQDWMVEEWSSQVGDEVEHLLQTFNSPPNISLRVNLLKTTREECRERLMQEGIETGPTPISPVGLISKKRFSVQSSPTFKEGWFEMQDEGSQLVAVIANPQPNDIVIDACAGAGGSAYE
jgi:16S rRNA (cytosine967-C5)-methyltransferase